MLKEYEQTLRERYIIYARNNVAFFNGSCDTCEAGHVQEIIYILRTLFGYTDDDIKALDVIAADLEYDVREKPRPRRVSVRVSV